MQLVIAPILQKIFGLPEYINYPISSLVNSLFEFSKEYKIPKSCIIACFGPDNQIIQDLFAYDKSFVFLKPIQVVANSPGLSGIIMGSLIIASAALLGPAGFIGTATANSLFFTGGLALASGLASAILYKKPKIPGIDNDDFAATPTYNFTGFSNKIGEGFHIPLVYGKSICSGTILDYDEDNVIYTSDKDIINIVGVKGPYTGTFPQNDTVNNSGSIPSRSNIPALNIWTLSTYTPTEEYSR